MVILRCYLLEQIDKDAFSVKSREAVRCPYCKGNFVVIGRRKRVIYRKDGSKIYLMIRRLRCIVCNKISHELPDMIVPYKRYEVSAIEQALSSPYSDCCCENSTLYHWKLWFSFLCAYLTTFLSSLYPPNCQSPNWLQTLVCTLVNSGQWYSTRFPSNTT